MDYLILIPISMTYIYGILTTNKNPKINTLIYALTIPVLLGALYLIFRNTLIISDLLTGLLVLETLIVFVMLRLGHKISLLFLFLFIVSIGFSLFLSLTYKNMSIYLSFIMMLIFLLAENNQVFMRKSYEEAATEYQNKILDKQVEEVQNIYFTMRGWRHDYHNHLQKLKAHIMMNQISEASKYLNDLEVDLDNVNQLVESGNINLDAILNSKISLALKNEIQINYKASVPKDLSVSDIDLCVLIGNLIDNAVEACDKIKDGNPRFIRIYVGIFKKQLYISVSNSTNELIKKLDEEYITTKRGNHGHGLKRINNIVNKYGGFINRQNEPGVFASEVLLPL